MTSSLRNRRGNAAGTWRAAKRCDQTRADIPTNAVRGPPGPSSLRVAALRPADRARGPPPVLLSQHLLIKGRDAPLGRTADPR